MANALEKIVCNFLWSSNLETRKYHLLAWHKVCVPIAKGDLGTRRILEINTALLSKWVRNFGIEGGILWKMVIEEKYGLSDGEWFTKKNLNTHCCSL